MAKVPELNDSNFESTVKQSTLPVLVDFGATWCGPCKQLAPIVEKLAADFQGKVQVYTVDIDDAPDTAKKYGIRSVPTVVFFKAGGEKAGQHVGLTSRDKLLALAGLS